MLFLSFFAQTLKFFMHAVRVKGLVWCNFIYLFFSGNWKLGAIPWVLGSYPFTLEMQVYKHPQAQKEKLLPSKKRLINTGPRLSQCRTKVSRVQSWLSLNSFCACWSSKKSVGVFPQICRKIVSYTEFYPLVKNWDPIRLLWLTFPNRSREHGKHLVSVISFLWRMSMFLNIQTCL